MPYVECPKLMTTLCWHFKILLFLISIVFRISLFVVLVVHNKYCIGISVFSFLYFNRKKSDNVSKGHQWFYSAWSWIGGNVGKGINVL